MDGQSGLHQSAEFFRQTRDANAAQGNIHHPSGRPLVFADAGVQLRRRLPHRRSAHRQRYRNTRLCFRPRALINWCCPRCSSRPSFTSRCAGPRMRKSWRRSILTPACRRSSVLPSTRSFPSLRRRNFRSAQSIFPTAQADARDAQTGEPIPEAPRFIWDTVGSID